MVDFITHPLTIAVYTFVTSFAFGWLLRKWTRMNERIESMTNKVTFLSGERDGAVSLLWDVQQDCIRERQRVNEAVAILRRIREAVVDDGREFSACAITRSTMDEIDEILAAEDHDPN